MKILPFNAPHLGTLLILALLLSVHSQSLAQEAPRAPKGGQPRKAALPPEPLSGWYAFNPDAGEGAGEDLLSLADWIGAPAGREGRIRSDGDRLVYAGRPIRLWGLNVCYSDCAPDRALADRKAEFYARNGINAVRLHKFADGTGWAGIQSRDSFVEFDPAELEKMDYFVAALKKRGIYVKLSANFGVNPGPADLGALPYAAEFGAPPGPGKRLDTKTGATYLSRELQVLQFEQMRRLLAHRNPHTGMTYAEDPAVAVVELINEDSALFFGTLAQLKKSATLRERFAVRFAKWLEARYRTEAELSTSWGEGWRNLLVGEGFDGEQWGVRIHPAGNPWFFDPEQLGGQFRVNRNRFLDTIAFLKEVQDRYYAEYTEVIRKAGYEGEILASNWQAGRAYSHYANLHSDSVVGMIDRHNYLSGPGRTMVSTPGSGSLSSGMMQVSGRPFMLSEWIHVWPNDYGVEGPALIGAYGMGLQGWDVSFMFQNKDDGRVLKQLGKQRWEVTAPQIIGIFPAVSRQVLRGDVRPAEEVLVRRVTLEKALQGALDFEDRMSQKGDIKTFDSDKVPAGSLAVSRTVVAFGEDSRGTDVVDLADYTDATGALRSSTGELTWWPGDTGKSGACTINTAGTVAFVGFGDDREHRLGIITLRPRLGFAAIYVTARGATGTLGNDPMLLVSAIGRARNSGMTFNEDGYPVSKGSAPILMEPVRFRLEIRRPGAERVEILDHGGRSTGRSVAIQDGSVELDTGRDGSPYYVVRFRR